MKNYKPEPSIDWIKIAIAKKNGELLLGITGENEGPLQLEPDKGELKKIKKSFEELMNSSVY